MMSTLFLLSHWRRSGTGWSQVSLDSISANMLIPTPFLSLLPTSAIISFSVEHQNVGLLGHSLLYLFLIFSVNILTKKNPI